MLLNNNFMRKALSIPTTQTIVYIHLFFNGI